MELQFQKQTISCLKPILQETKQQELTRFAETQGLDVKETAVAEAIQNADYAALVAESMKKEKTVTKPVVASYAMGGGITAKGEYDDLLKKA